MGELNEWMTKRYIPMCGCLFAGAFLAKTILGTQLITLSIFPLILFGLSVIILEINTIEKKVSN